MVINSTLLGHIPVLFQRVSLFLSLSCDFFLTYFTSIFWFSLNHQAVPSCRKDSCEWQPVEAALYCMQAVAKSVPVLEGEMMPQV